MRLSFVRWALPTLFLLVLPFNCNASNALMAFLNRSFDEVPKPKRLWVNKEKQNYIKTTFNPSQLKLSYRYWQKDKQTLWVLDEIGKERNITTGIIVENDKIKSVEIIKYRESRGGQVQSRRFTNQYQNKTMKSKFSKEIDSISGATLSVNAINKQVALALYLNTLRQ